MHYRMSGLLSRLQATAYFIFCPQLRRNRGGSDVWRWCRSHGVEPWCLPEIFHSLIWMINTGVKALSLLRRGLNARIGKKKKKKKSTIQQPGYTRGSQWYRFQTIAWLDSTSVWHTALGRYSTTVSLLLLPVPLSESSYPVSCCDCKYHLVQPWKTTKRGQKTTGCGPKAHMGCIMTPMDLCAIPPCDVLGYFSHIWGAADSDRHLVPEWTDANDWQWPVRCYNYWCFTFWHL